MPDPIVSQNYTYSKLVALCQSYCERSDDDFLQNIPSFITLAENYLATIMKQEGFMLVVGGHFNPNATLEKPAFWRETVALTYKNADGEWVPVYLRSLEYLKQYWPKAALRAAPAYYAEYNINNWYIAPTPDVEYEFELIYYARLDPLTEEHQQNWLTLNAPQALLYAMLKEAGTWAGSARTQEWQAARDEAVASLLGENKQRVADRQTLVKP